MISDIFIQKLCNRGTYTLNLWHLNNLCKQHVLDMFYSCNFLVLNLEIIEQSVVILWVNWRVNKYFWQRFTCIVLRRQPFMRKLVNKMTTSIEALQFFTLNQWSWSNTNLKKLQSTLVNTKDGSLETFSFDMRSLDWKIFIDHYVLGTRHYVLKNNPDSMDSSRKKLKIFYFLHFIIQLAFVFFIVYNVMTSIYWINLSCDLTYW